MKRILYFPRFTAISVALMLTAGVIVVSGFSCATKQKPGCGSKHQHKVRAKKVKRMAPSMGG